MEVEPVEQLAVIAPRMQGLSASPGAALFYELMSDALVWSDEIPDFEKGYSGDFHCLRFVFRYRTTLILGQPDPRYQKIWDAARRLFPEWPGFEPRRQAPELRPVYERYFEQAKVDIRELFDKPAR